MREKAVISLFNTPSGLFRWWDDFPRFITGELDNLQIDHHLFYRSYTANSIYSEDDQHPIPDGALNDRRWIDENIGAIAARYRSVIIHSHSFYPPHKIWRVVFLQQHRRWVVTEHRVGRHSALFLKRPLKKLQRLFDLAPSRIIGVSEAVVQYNSQCYGANDVSLIYNGIIGPARKPSRPQAKESSTVSTVIYLGRLDEKKGIWNLCEAFALLAKKHQRTDIRLIVVGGGNNLDELESFITRNGLTDTVQSVGYQHNPAPYLEQADFLIQPTLIAEACPLSVLEALAHGVPVLHSNTGGLAEIVNEGVSGIAMDGTSPEQIANAVLSMADNRAQLQVLKKNSSQGMEEFSMHKMVCAYVQFYLDEFKTL